MLEQVTWSQWFMTAGTIATVYYSAILLLFYRGSLSQLIFARKAAVKTTSQKSSIASTPFQKDASQTLVHELMQDIKGDLERAVKLGYNEEHVIDEIRTRLRHYSKLKGSGYEEAISEHIAEELQTRCGITIHVAAINILW